jgi:hypothetical protein
MPQSVDLVKLREMAESVGCILKHDEAAGMVAMIPRNECVRPVEDMTPRVVSIASFQRKQCPKSFLGKFRRFTMPDHDPDGPEAA